MEIYIVANFATKKFQKQQLQIFFKIGVLKKFGNIHRKTTPVLYSVGFREDLFLISLLRNSQRCFVEKGALKIFANFHKKKPVLDFLINKVTSLGLQL